MASLTQTAITTRKTIRYGIFLVIFLIVGKIILSGAINLYKKIFPPPPPPPTVSYGKLPKLTLPSLSLPSNITFSLETPEGGLPKIQEQAKVYFMPKTSSNLLSLSVAQANAEKMGFNPNGRQISQTIYQFGHKENPSTLEINIVSGVFSVSYDLKVDSEPLSVKPPSPEIAASYARSFLSSANLLPKDLTGPVKSEFLQIKDGDFTSALSLSESDLVKIGLARKDYDNLPVTYSDFDNTNVWFIVSGLSDRRKQIIAAEYHYFPVDETQYATYPIKTTETAWNEFIQGKSSIVKTGSNKEGGSVKIRKIYLAYYDSGTVNDFLQPVYVFKGDGDFVSYLPAVTPDYYGE